MKKLLAAACIFILLGSSSPASAMITSDSGGEALLETGCFSIAISTCWLSLDLSQNQSSVESRTCDNLEIAAGFLSFADITASTLPALLQWSHSNYFVNIPDEEKVTFSVKYEDSFGNMPSTGYPKTIYWKQGANGYTTLPLTLSGPIGAGFMYKTSVALASGAYYYKYCAKNDNYPSEYELATSSFVVSRRPSPLTNNGLQDGIVTSNGKILLKWASSGTESGDLTYRLYVGKTASSLQLVYEGKEAFYELKSMELGQNYYWQVEAVNIYGVSIKSAVFAFSTIGKIKKAFNYPNPFNPAIGETTNITFDMRERGQSEVQVYSESGNLCWQRTYYGLPKGINEITYDGKDDCGSMMYNGTYIAVIKKHYGEIEEKERCRLLVIK